MPREAPGHGGGEVQALAAGDLAGAQGDRQGKGEADAEVHQADDRDPDAGADRDRVDTERTAGECERAGRQRDVSDIERKAEHQPDDRGHAEQEAERDVAADAGCVVNDEVRDALHPLAPEHLGAEPVVA